MVIKLDSVYHNILTILQWNWEKKRVQILLFQFK